MNVDIFKSDPDVKYYFASAVPMMVVVLVGWYIIKHLLARRRQTVRRTLSTPNLASYQYKIADSDTY